MSFSVRSLSLTLFQTIFKGRQVEVARFPVVSPSFIKTIKLISHLTTNYLEGRLEQYLDRVRNMKHILLSITVGNNVAINIRVHSFNQSTVTPFITSQHTFAAYQ